MIEKFHKKCSKCGNEWDCTGYPFLENKSKLCESALDENQCMCPLCWDAFHFIEIDTLIKHIIETCYAYGAEKYLVSIYI
jgi:hypothetical protein